MRFGQESDVAMFRVQSIYTRVPEPTLPPSRKWKKSQKKIRREKRQKGGRR